MCTVFAESGGISHTGTFRSKTYCGGSRSTADRIFGMMSRVGVEKDVALVGGVARNVGVVRKVEERSLCKRGSGADG